MVTQTLTLTQSHSIRLSVWAVVLDFVASYVCVYSKTRKKGQERDRPESWITYHKLAKCESECQCIGRPQGLQPLPTLELQKFGNCGKSESPAHPASENQCTIIFEFVPGLKKSSLFAASIPGTESWLFLSHVPGMSWQRKIVFHRL